MNIKTKRDRLKTLEGKVRPAECVKVIWCKIGDPDPEELIQARLKGDTIIDWSQIEGGNFEEDQPEEEG